MTRRQALATDGEANVEGRDKLKPERVLYPSSTLIKPTILGLNLVTSRFCLESDQRAVHAISRAKSGSLGAATEAQLYVTKALPDEFTV